MKVNDFCNFFPQMLGRLSERQPPETARETESRFTLLLSKEYVPKSCDSYRRMKAFSCPQRL